MSETPSVSKRREKALSYMAEQRARAAEQLARSMHEGVCGSWEAAGYEIKVAFREAGFAAYDVLAKEHGYDLFAFPDGGWALVT